MHPINACRKMRLIAPAHRDLLLPGNVAGGQGAVRYRDPEKRRGAGDEASAMFIHLLLHDCRVFIFMFSVFSPAS
jgi:hypothetical protein